jgi:hypothetical protein
MLAFFVYLSVHPNLILTRSKLLLKTTYSCSKVGLTVAPLGSLFGSCSLPLRFLFGSKRR